MKERGEMEIRQLLKDCWFLCFSDGTSKEDAQKKFQDKYKYEPEVTLWSDGMMWVGPLKEKPA